jgi:hypothetical protein
VKEKEIIAFEERLSILVEVIIEEPVIKSAIQRYVKGSLANIHVGAFAQTLLEHTQVAENARAKRKQGFTEKPRSYVSVGRHFSLRYCAIIGMGEIT